LEAQAQAAAKAQEVQPSMKVTLELFGVGGNSNGTTEVQIPLGGPAQVNVNTSAATTTAAAAAPTSKKPAGHPAFIPKKGGEEDKKKKEETASADKKSAADGKDPKPSRDRLISVEEVSKHNKEDDCWVIISGYVLNMTHFLNEHPGGKNAILLYAGKDATDEFNMMHTFDYIEKYAPGKKKKKIFLYN